MSDFWSFIVMANLTAETELSSDWKNIALALNLAGGSYTVDLVRVTAGGIVYQALTDNADEPVNIFGHPWRTTNNGLAVDSRRINIVAGQVLWMRVKPGTGILVVSPA